MNLTPDDLRAMKTRGEKITALTAYDYPMARLLDESGIDLLLVGDSLGMVVLGFPDTTFVTMEHMVHHCEAAARGVKRAFIVADLPYASYETPGQAVENSRRLIRAGAHAVKLEGALIPQIETIVAAGIPLVAHLGMLPQSVRIEGGYKIKGRTPSEADALVDAAQAIEAAGACALVLELVQADTTRRITTALSIPTIGIGSGPDCDGQVLVTHDLIGLFPWFKPKFVSRQANVAEGIRQAVTGFVEQTRAR